jgi:hypothetical protein
MNPVSLKFKSIALGVYAHTELYSLAHVTRREQAAQYTLSFQGGGKRAVNSSMATQGSTIALWLLPPALLACAAPALVRAEGWRIDD